MAFAGTIGGGFFIGLLSGYAIKKIIKIAAVIVGLFIAALAYLEFQRIIDVNWAKIQAVSQNDLTPIQRVNEAYERVINSDVRYRFVIDMKSLDSKDR